MNKNELRILCKKLYEEAYRKYKNEFDYGNIIIQKIYNNKEIIYKNVNRNCIPNELFDTILNHNSFNKLKEINIVLNGKILLPLKLN